MSNKDMQQMMNSVMQSFENSSACADCNADVRVETPTPNVHRFLVMHDDSCPFLKGYEKRNAARRNAANKRRKKK